MAEIRAQAKNASISMTVKIRVNLSIHHLFAACRFAARVAQIEQEHAGQPFGEFWEEILHNSLGVATLTVASIESYANELYFEGSILTSTLSMAAANEIAKLIDRESILQKYSIALAVQTGKHLDFGIAPVQNASALIKLRNAIVHFRSEWIGEQGKHEELSNKFLKNKFKPSAYFPNEPVFPNAWASHDFTIWALRTTIQFLDHFYSEAGVPSPIDTHRNTLQTLSGSKL
jgi:hypothetical protein